MLKTEYSTGEMPKILGQTRQYVWGRAVNEDWTISKRSNRQGGHLYRYADLPEDVNLAIARQMVKAEPKRVLDGARIPDWSNRIGLARYRLVMEWRAYRQQQAKKGQRKTQATAAFILGYNGGKLLPEVFEALKETRKSSLYRWDQILKDHGDDYQVLCDRRGQWAKGGAKKGLGNIKPEAAEAFLAAWLTPNKPSIHLAYEVMASVLSKNESRPEIPSMASVYRFARRYMEEHYNLYVLQREGEKALNDKALPYINRDWRTLEVGDCLFADGHVLNFECRHPETGRPFRPVLIVWSDARSDKPVGWEVMTTENTVAISSGLRMAIINLGKIPKVAYLDNGRAFKSKFFTGEDPDFEALSGLYARLGIALQLARPYHGQTKKVERFFGTFNEQFARMMPSYTGRDIYDKPAWRQRNERYHQARIGNRGLLIPTLRQVMDMFRAYVDWFAQKEHPTQKGVTRADVFNAGRGPGVDPVELDRHFLWSKRVRPRRTGFTLAGVRYESDALFGINQEIVIRFSWADLSEVCLYDLDGDFLGKAYPQAEVHPLADKLGDEHDKAMVADKNRRYNRLKRDTMREARAMNASLADRSDLRELPYLPDSFDLSPPERAKRQAALNNASTDAPPHLETEGNSESLPYYEIKISPEEKAELDAIYEKAINDKAQWPKLERPIWFANEFERYEFLFKAILDGFELTAEERAFMQSYESSYEYEHITGARYEQLRAAYGLKKDEGVC